MHTQERRRAKRFPLDLKGCVVINGSNFGLKVHDGSLTGVLVEFVANQPIVLGAKLRVRLYIGFSGRAIVCRNYTHNNCTFYGITFDRFDYYSDLVLNAYLVKHEQHLSGTRTLH